MINFRRTVSESVLKSLQGMWSNNHITLDFKLQIKNYHTDPNYVDLYLYIDNDNKGEVGLAFTSEGVCFIEINGVKTYQILYMVNKEDDSYCMKLKGNNDVEFIEFKKMS